eukprot:m51a1_g14720 putative vacuolar protein sorting-associated protein 52 homolog (704) ;mRNA; f:190647-193351
MEDPLELFDPEAIDEAIASMEGMTSIEDLREHRLSLESEISSVEALLVSDYVQQAEDNARLWRELKDVASCVDSTYTAFSSFRVDLEEIASRIGELHARSGDVRLLCQNRRAAIDTLHNAIDAVAVPPELVREVISGEVGEQYCTLLATLEKKLTPPEPYSSSAAFKSELCNVCSMLCSIASMRVRDYLCHQLMGLTKPGTNVQIQQQAVFEKQRIMNHFLVCHAPHYAVEIRERYVETMAPNLFSYFSIYVNKMAELEYKIGTKEDLIGLVNQNKAGARTWIPFASPADSAHKSKSSVFSLKNYNTTTVSSRAPAQTSRLEILAELDKPSVVPHVAEQHGLRFPFEAVFRSCMQILIDTVSSEYLFQVRWFRTPDGKGWDESIKTMLFRGIFGRVLFLYREKVVKFAEDTYDSIALLLMLKIVQHCTGTATRRCVKIPDLFLFLEELDDILWQRFKKVISMNAESLKSVKPIPPDTRPHFATRQYAELCASVRAIVLNHTEMEDVMRSLRAEAESFFVNLSTAAEGPIASTVSLINNYDHILSVLREQERSSGLEQSEDSARFQFLLDSRRLSYVEQELAQHFAQLVTFCKSLDPPADGMTSPQPDRSVKTIETVVFDFNATWKSGLKMLEADAMQFFPSLALGSEVLRQALGLFSTMYARLEDTVRRAQRRPEAAALAKAFIPHAAVSYEVKKHNIGTTFV